MLLNYLFKSNEVVRISLCICKYHKYWWINDIIHNRVIQIMTSWTLRRWCNVRWISNCILSSKNSVQEHILVTFYISGRVLIACWITSLTGKVHTFSIYCCYRKISNLSNNIVGSLSLLCSKFYLLFLPEFPKKFSFLFLYLTYYSHNSFCS